MFAQFARTHRPAWQLAEDSIVPEKRCSCRLCEGCRNTVSLCGPCYKCQLNCVAVPVSSFGLRILKADKPEFVYVPGEQVEEPATLEWEGKEPKYRPEGLNGELEKSGHREGMDRGMEYEGQKEGRRGNGKEDTGSETSTEADSDGMDN
jgi:hypothetical protein